MPRREHRLGRELQAWARASGAGLVRMGTVYTSYKSSYNEEFDVRWLKDIILS